MDRNAMVYRGEIYYADLDPVVGSEQNGVRPVLIIQNDVGNKHSPTTIVAPITSKREKRWMPTHIKVKQSVGLERDSIILAEQLRTIDKERLQYLAADLDRRTMWKVNLALIISLGIGEK